MTSADILAIATLPECISFIHAAKSRGKCWRPSCRLNLHSHTYTFTVQLCAVIS